MRAVLVLGGDITDYEYIKTFIKGDDYIICADSGYIHAVKMGITADLVIGDFDSLDIEKYTMPESVIRLPVRKDFTDAEAALSESIKAGYKEILILGATGSRLDHLLANVMLLNDCLQNGVNAVIIDENNTVQITDKAAEVFGETGSLVSLVPLCECTGVTTENLEYPLNGAHLRLGETRGISNVMTAERASVRIDSGLLLIIVSRD